MRGELSWMVHSQSMNSALFTDYELIGDVEGHHLSLSLTAPRTIRRKKQPTG